MMGWFGQVKSAVFIDIYSQDVNPHLRVKSTISKGFKFFCRLWNDMGKLEQIFLLQAINEPRCGCQAIIWWQLWPPFSFSKNTKNVLLWWSHSIALVNTFKSSCVLQKSGTGCNLGGVARGIMFLPTPADRETLGLMVCLETFEGFMMLLNNKETLAYNS